MSARARHLATAIGAASLLWFIMFSPWTAGLVNFWLAMSLSALVLTSLALAFGRPRRPSPSIERPPLQLLAGVAIAFALWGVFWIGDRLSSLVFDFARPGVDAVYSMKTGLSDRGIALLLLLVIGPAEEYFWRGYVQKTFALLFDGLRAGPEAALVATTVIYGLIHIWSFNFMLVAAALVAGGVWGLIYRINPRLLPALIVSHAIWDVLVFIVMPIN